MIQIPAPAVSKDHPDRQLWCQISLHTAFTAMAACATAAGWGEREVASALVDLADNHMLGLINTGALEAIFEAIKKQS